MKIKLYFVLPSILGSLFLSLNNSYGLACALRFDGCYAKQDTLATKEIAYSCFIFYPNNVFVYTSLIFPKNNVLKLSDFLNTADDEVSQLVGQYEVTDGKLLLSHFSKKRLLEGVIDFPWEKRRLNATCTTNGITMQDVGFSEVKPGEVFSKDFRFKYQFMPLSFPLDSVLSSLKR